LWKIASLAGLGLLAGCGSTGPIIRVTENPRLECQFHRRGTLEAHKNFLGCYYWSLKGCTVVIPPNRPDVLKHELRHCYEGNWHRDGYDEDDLKGETDAQH